MPHEQTGFSQQALRRCVPYIANPTKQENQLDNKTKPTENTPTNATNQPDTEESQYAYTIDLLRAILKRPSEKTDKHNKHVTFNPNITYHNIDKETASDKPTPTEEDGLEQNQDNQRQSNKQEAYDKHIINLETLQTIPTPEKDRPKTFTQDDIDNIPDTVDAPKKHINLEDAQLPYLNALYGDHYTPQSRQTSLIDTGASFSFMHSDIFNRIPNHKSYIQSKKPLQIRTGAKDQLLQDTATIAIIPFTFKDNDNNFHTVTSLFLVVSVISNEVFLGNDVMMRSKIFQNINTHTFDYINPKTTTRHTIPITWIKTTPYIKLLADHTFELPPYTTLNIPTRPDTEPPQNQMIITKDLGDTPEETKNMLHVTTMRINPIINTTIPVIITNNSEHYMRIERNEEIASLVDTKTQMPYVHIAKVNAETYETTTHENDEENKTKMHDDEIIKVNQNQQWHKKRNLPDQSWQHEIPSPIKDYETGKTREELDTIEYVKRQLKQEKSMNDEERAEALETFKMTGKYQHTVTRVIENNAKLSELKKDNKKKLTPKQCVNSLNLNHFSPETQTKIRDIFMKYESVLAKSDFDIPRAKGILADPIIRQEYVNQCMTVKYKPINLNIRDEVQEILSNMCDAGVIEETDEPTPFLSNLLVAKKRSGQLRLLYDCRPSNMAIINIPSTFTPKSDITYILGKAGLVSSIDLSNSYFQIGIHPDKRSLFSFCDAYGKRYRYCVLAQGFHSSPFYLTTLLNKVLKGLESNVTYYADDIFIHTNKEQTLDDHLQIIEDVLKRLQSFNLKVKCSKVEIAPPCINILGVTRGTDGKFRIPEDKASILAKWPEPKTTDEIKSYISTVNYFNDHIYDFWNLVLPLQEQSKEKTNKPQITLTKESKSAFEKLKIAITKHIAISAPDLDKEFYISSDSSGFASAALLYQVRDNTVHYLGAASRLYTKQERKYSTIKLEIMALLYAFSKWDYILRYSRHTINALTDAKGILYIKNGKDTTNMLYRISQIISHYEIRIMHTSGNPKPANSNLHHNKSRSNWLPDIISRCIKPKTIQNHKPISEKELDYLMELLVLKEGYTITPQQLQKFMREPGLPSPTRGPQTKRTSKVKVNPTNVQPIKKTPKKKHPPQFVNKHKYYPNQIMDNENNLTDYTKAGSKQYNTLINPAPNAKEQNPPQTDKIISSNLNEMKPIQIFPTREEAQDYTYHRYADDDIPCHALNIIRLLLDYEHKPNPNQETQDNTDNNQPEIPPTDEETKLIQEANTITTDDITERLIINSKLIQDGMIALSVLRDAQTTDPLISTIKAKDPLPNRYSIKNGFLLHETNGQQKFVIPQSLFTIVQNSLHHQIWGRHQPAEKMYQILTKHFYLPGLMATLKRIVTSCMVCNTTKLKNTKRQNFGKKKLPLANREMWMADIGGGYEEGPAKYFVIFVDALTLFSVAVAIPNKNTDTLLNAFIEHIINIFGTPNYFYSDNEPAFDSNEFKEYCSTEDITILHAAPYASFSNGNCETHIKLAKEIVRAYTRSTGLSYKTVLPDITRSLNYRPLTSDKDLTPAKLMFGSNLHPQLLTSSTNYTDPEKYLTDFMSYMEENSKRHRERRNKNAERQREYHNKSRKEIEFKEGQHVYYRSFKIPETKGALANKWNGPAVIITLHDNGHTATIRDYDDNTRKMHTQHLKHYDTNGQPTIAPTHLEDRAIQILQSQPNAKPSNVHHLPITRSATASRETQLNDNEITTDTPPDSMEQFDFHEQDDETPNTQLIIEENVQLPTEDGNETGQPAKETPTTILDTPNPENHTQIPTPHIIPFTRNKQQNNTVPKPIETHRQNENTQTTDNTNKPPKPHVIRFTKNR